MKNYYFTALIALCTILWGCSENDPNGLKEGEGTITISIVGSGNARSTVTMSDVEESAINSYHVYVFGWSSGIREASVPGTKVGTDYKTSIPNLSTATSKRIVVLTNLDSYPDVANYSDLSLAANKIDLDDQDPDVVKTKGYIMSGQNATALTITSGTNPPVPISVERVVAKVSLETIKFVPAEGHDIEKLVINGVSVQRVAPEVILAPITSYYTTGPGGFHYGGFPSADSELQVKTFLKDDLALGATPYNEDDPYDLGNYFLVFPHATPATCTLLTISGTYAGDPIYYPIKINYETGDLSTDGTYIKNNKHYKLNLTVKKLGEGTTDPEVPPTKGDIEVVVTVEDWATIIQNEEW